MVLDIRVAAAAIAAAEGGTTRIVCQPAGIADNATHTVVHFKACHLVAESLQLIGLHQSAGSFALCMDSRGDVAGLTIHLRGQIGRRKALLAAARRNLALDVVAGLHDGGVGACLRKRNLLAKLTDVALHLVAEITDPVADVGQAVVDLPKLLAVQDLLLAGRRGVLAVLALPVPAVSAEAEHKQEQHDDQEPAGAPAAALVAVAGDGRDVGKTIIIRG